MDGWRDGWMDIGWREGERSGEVGREGGREKGGGANVLYSHREDGARKIENHHHAINIVADERTMPAAFSVTTTDEARKGHLSKQKHIRAHQRCRRHPNGRVINVFTDDNNNSSHGLRSPNLNDLPNGSALEK